MTFDSLSFKSKHSFLSEFFDDIDKLNNPNPKNESTKEKKIHVYDEVSELYNDFLAIYYHKYYSYWMIKEKNRVQI